MDHRDLVRETGKWYDSFDPKTMIATLEIEKEDGWMETVTMDCEYQVCETCGGKGTHVNPGIDSNGLSRDYFDEDPDFMEDYFRGRYDVPCYECGGQRVVPWPVNENGQEIVQKILYEKHAYAAECIREREIGY